MSMNKQKNWTIGAFLAIALLGCASAPETHEERASVETSAGNALTAMKSRDPSLNDVLANAAGYIVFPEVREGGFIVGGMGGVGVVYEGNRPIGFSELRAGSVGAQVGGQSYSQLVVFNTREALDRFRAGNFAMSANVTATAIRSGAGRTAHFDNGVAVFVEDQSGLMAGASLRGQNMSFTSNRPH